MIETRWPIWAHHPLELRPGTSDLDVFHQVFTGREYACLDDLPFTPDLVIDCGAYAGYSAAYFLSKWPDCHLVAIEADPGNAATCAANLAPYSGRAKIAHAAVWPHDRGVRPASGRYRDGREWSLQVCEARRTATIPSIDLNRIVPTDRQTLLKMDIEGAEAVVFSAPDLSWLDRIACLVIEIHDDSTFGPCSELIASAMTSRGFAASPHGELTVFRKFS